MRLKLAPVAGALVVAGIAFVGAQTPPQMPPRDQPRIAVAGSAGVTGSVVADDQAPTPLRRATVTLSRTGIEDIRSTTTDDEGRFEFRALPAGSYSLSAAKGAYLPMSYGAPKPGMPGSSIALAEGQTFAARPIVLWRGSVIAGRLTDRHGQPVANASVEANQFVMVSGERRRRTGSQGTSAMTNAHGDYRIYGLMPGDYLVSSAPPPMAVQAEATLAELTWATHGNGPVPPPARAFTYAPTMFPGTADAAAGVIITIGRGEERLGVDFAMQFVPVSRVSGVVTGPDGEPVPGIVVFCSAKNPSPMLPPSGLPISRTSAAGSFVCPQLAPGPYTIAARGAVPPPAANRVSAVSPLWALTDVTAAGQDIPDLVLRLQSGQQLSGQVVSRVAASNASLDPARVQVRLTPGAGASPIAGSSSGTTGADGVLKVEGVVPGSYRITATAPAGWFLRSAMLAGKDVADVPFDVSAGRDVVGLVLSFSDVQTELTGVLTDGAGTPAPQLYVVVFSTDRSLWVGESRRIRSVRSGDNGSYAIAGLPPGEYYLCALTELDTALQFEPEYLEQLVPASIKITLGEGEKKKQDLRIGGAPESQKSEVTSQK
jgi:protocatechuate 3,4-dioxygenase beta subunit